MKQMTIKTALFLLSYTLLVSCNNGKNTSPTTNSEPKKEETNQTSTPKKPTAQDVAVPIEVMLSFNNLGEDEKGSPRSEILLKVDTKEKKIATIMGGAQVIKPTEYANFDIPNTATSACYSWYAGAGDYFYSIFKNNEVMVYRGWQDEMQEEDGYHWELMDLNQ